MDGRQDPRDGTLTGPQENLKQMTQDTRQAKGIKFKTDQFAKRMGRRPRVLISSAGMNGHYPAGKLLAASLAEWGFDVDIAPAKQTPRQAARTAVENDVHAICFFSNAQNTGVTSQLVDALADNDGQNILIAVCGDVPAEEHAQLYQAGIAGIWNCDPTFFPELHQLIELMEK